MTMYRTLKIRIYPNATQKRTISTNCNAMRFVRNQYIAYINSNNFVRMRVFRKEFNKMKYLNDDFSWIVDEKVSTKAITDALQQEEHRWLRYFQSIQKVKLGETSKSNKRPTFISKKKQNKMSFFIIKDNIRFESLGRRIVSLPIIGKVRITEDKDKLPSKDSITSGYIIKEGNRYYLSLRYKIKTFESKKDTTRIGIDLGIKSYATIAYKMNDSTMVFSVDHFMRSKKYRSIQKRINKLQKIISNKAEMNYGKLLNDWLDTHPNEKVSENIKNIKKGESYNTSNIRKLQYKIKKLYNKLVNIRKNFIYELVLNVVTRAKHPLTVPECITIEDLSIRKMLKNIPNEKNDHCLHKYISESNWYLFSQYMKNTCELYSCELRISNKFYASSQICCKCGYRNRNLTLLDRTYGCPKCGNTIDRDENASINLVNATDYTVYA